MRLRAAEAALAQALRQFEAGKLSFADKACRRLPDVAPRHAAAWNRQGAVKLWLGQFDTATEAWRRAVAVAPDVAQYHSNLGAPLQTARRPAEAEQAFARPAALTALGRLEEPVAWRASGAGPARCRGTLAARPGWAAGHATLGPIPNRQLSSEAAVAASPHAAATLQVFPWQSQARLHGLLDAMDVALDAPVFSGYTTAWAAAHRGLPMVAMEGPFLRQRLAAGLLRRIGRDNTIG